jgi:hypothetical protein
VAFALQLRKKHGKNSIRVVEKCPDIPVLFVQYTFTHEQYTEQHSDTERNIHNNKMAWSKARGVQETQVEPENDDIERNVHKIEVSLHPHSPAA